MTRPRAKGTAYESAVVDWLRQNGWPYAERRALKGKRDRGDIAGIPGVCLELKNHASNQIDLAGALDEARTEADNAGVPIAAAVIHRRRRGVADSYVVMDLETFARLLSEEG